MESARPNALRSFVILGVAFLVGYVVANPAGTVWRARYWMPFGDRAAALEKLVAVEPVGAESELGHALEADDAKLRLAAASVLAARGEKRGLEALVMMCGDGEAEGTPPRGEIERLLEEPEEIGEYDSVKEWYEAKRHYLKCDAHAVWRERRNE